MALTPDETMAAFMAEPAQSQYGFATGILPNLYGIQEDTPGTVATTQMVFPGVLTYNISRTQDQSSDTCTFTLADDQSTMLSTNHAASRAYMFYPGPIDKKMSLYLGYRGPINSGKPNFVNYANEAIIQFTGFVETDANAQSFARMDKTVTLNDLTSQFKFQVYDTFPHALWGNQTLTYFDPTYNLTSTDGITWQCDGRMFTSNSNDPVWGSTNLPVLVYVDLTGDTPQDTPLGGTSNYASPPVFPNTIGQDQKGWFSFDFANGIITFHDAGLKAMGYPNGIPLTSAVSVQGNPTYMAPETMIYKLLVEKAGWDPTKLDLQATNLLMPMFDGQDQSIWDCMSAIIGMCAPRFIPWKIWCDESGKIHLYEINLDAPPKRHWINGQGIITSSHEYTARDVRTVVRGDGTVAIAGNGVNAGSDQSITSIAYDNRSIAEYGLTEPMLLTQAVVDSVRHLSPTQAIAHLNLIAQATLYEVSRPVYTITADMLPDYFVQIGDKVRYTDNNIGVDDEFQLIGMDKSSDGKVASMQVTLEQYYETINMNLGVPSGVSYDEANHGATQAPPNSGIFWSVMMGNKPSIYVYKFGDYVRDLNNNPIIPTWDATDLGAMHLDYQLASKNKSEGLHDEYSYHNLPPLSSPWEAEKAPGTGDTVYYVPKNASDGYTYYVGPGSTFYRYSNGPPKNDPPNEGNSDYHISHFDTQPQYVWTPPGNNDPNQHNGKGYDVYVWAWWYLCLDSTVEDPVTNKPYWSEPFKEKNGRLMMRLDPLFDGNDMNHRDAHKITIGDNKTVWIYNSWPGYPGPFFSTGGCTKLYKNLVIGASDYTTPPPGFIGANVMGDGVNIGVAYGADASSGNTYVNYQKKTRGHYCLYAASDDGGSQFLRIPFNVIL